MKQPVAVDLFYDGAWREQVSAVYERDPITITRGEPSTCTLTFANDDGRYSPKSIISPLYGKIGQNTPLRVRLDVDPLHRDPFTRTESNGWGTSPSAGGYSSAWTSGTIADFAVNGTQATHAVTTAATYLISYLEDVQSDDPDVQVSVTIPTPTGGDLEPCVLLAGTGTTTYLMMRAAVSTAGVVTLRAIAVVDNVETTIASAAAGFTFSAAAGAVTLRGRISAGQIEMMAYQGDTAPSVWALDFYSTTYQARGWVGVRSGRATGNTNAGTQFAYDNLVVRSGRTRFVGEVSTWTPERAVKGDAWCKVVASGVRARLGRGVDPLKSSARQYYENSGALGYWAMEPGTRMSNTVDVERPLQFTGTNIDFGVYDGPGGSDKGPKFFLNDDRPPVSQVFAPLNGTSTSWIVNLWFRAHAGPESAIFFTPVVDFVEIATEGTVAFWTVEALSYPAGPQFEVTVTGYDSGRDIISPTVSAVVDTEIIDDKWHMVTVQGEQTGGNAVVSLTIDAGSGASNFTGSYTNGRLLGVYLPKRVDASNVADPSMMHLVAYDDTSPSYADMFYAGQGWPGETVAERFLRIMDEQSIPAFVVGDATDTVSMGPQVRKTLLQLLDEFERTDDCLVYEPRSVLGLALRTSESILDQKPRLTLDYRGRQISPTPALKPVVGDAHIRNDVTASNYSGGEARVEQTTGPLNTQLPGAAAGAVGRYPTRVDVNAGDLDGPNDAVLPDLAGWRVHKGTFDGTWYATVAVDLDAAPYLAPMAGAIDYGDVLQLASLPDDEALDAVDHLVMSYVEVIGTHRRKLTYRLEPARPYMTGVLSGTTGDTGEFVGHLETDGSTTNGATAALAATFSVATPSGPLWSTDSDDYPQDFTVGGQRVTVSGVAGGSSPQTFTVSTSISGRKIVYPVPTGSAVEVYTGVILTK